MSGEPVPIEVCTECEEMIGLNIGSADGICEECGNETNVIYGDSRRRKSRAERYFQESSDELTADEPTKVQEGIMGLRERMVELKNNVDGISNEIQLINKNIGSIEEKINRQEEDLGEIKRSTGFHIQDISSIPTKKIQLMITLFLVSISVFQIIDPSQSIVTKLSTGGAIAFVVPLLVDYIQDRG